MKKLTKAFLCFGLIATLLLGGCSGDSDNGNDTTLSQDTEPVDTPEVTPADHDISVSEVESILAANGLSTNQRRWTTEACAYHGGHQIRVCHTERGTYAAFARDYGDGDGIQKFYVAKIDNEKKVSILYYGGFKADDGSITVNVFQDENGDILVTATSSEVLSVFAFDSETDEMTKYETKPNFSTDVIPGYGQTMFDIDSRKIYLFAAAGSWSSSAKLGDFLLEWFVFDLETMQWSESSTYVWLKDIGRHCYMYPLPDGNGGAYMVAVRDEKIAYVADRLTNVAGDTYVWDRLNLFHIPDLTTGENITWTTVQFEDDSRGHEGIWSSATCGHYGDVFVDSNGYMHITYRFDLADYAGTHTGFDNNAQYRHAVYNGNECILNEEIGIETESSGYYKFVVRQNSDGKLHLIMTKLWSPNVEIQIYSADDEIGKTWKLEKSVTVEENVRADSFSVSATQYGSADDGTFSCFFYGAANGSSYRSGFTFNVSLDDYSVTELVDILADSDSKVDDVRYDKKIPSSDHQTQMVHTENGIYAAFVYNYDHRDETEHYHIVKIDNDNKVTVLHSDSYGSSQNKYLTVSTDDNGTVFVCPPSGMYVYLIDTKTDEVTRHELTNMLSKNLFPRQMNIISTVDGTKYCVSVLENTALNVSSNVIDEESLTVKFKNIIKYDNDRDLIGVYNSTYVLGDGKNGAYIIGTRTVNRDELDGKLVYDSYISEINDSILMSYIPNLSEGGEIRCIDVHTPYEDEGDRGIWSSVKVKDVYLSSDGKLNILYSDHHVDYGKAHISAKTGIVPGTLKHYLAVYDGSELVSKEEIDIGELTELSSVRIAETSDGTMYLITCNLQNDERDNAKVSVYYKTENEWMSAIDKELGDFSADGFIINNSETGDSMDCLVYASNRDVYYVNILFTAK